MKILVFSNLYPNSCNPNFGIFTRNRTLALSEIKSVEVKVVAPVPYFPPINISNKWYRYSKIPSYEVIDGIEVFHPRYFVTPKIGMFFYGYWMYQGVRKTIERIRNEFFFDVIDAHFVYPDGYTACLLGDFFNCPVVLNALGSDITAYSQIAHIQKLVSKALAGADHLIAVSNSLRDIMIANGASPENVSVVPNGIDPKRFYLKDSFLVRQSLGFSNDEKLILTVCSLVELKGVHLLIEAAAMLKESYLGKFKILVAGTGPEKDRLNDMIEHFNLHEQVRLLGNVPNHELVDWYNAADIFFLGSSREGWPNVVCEALACGTPVVATHVNGIPEILNEAYLGIMVERTPEAFSRGIRDSLGRNWNAQAIAQKGQQRTWKKVASEVFDLFSEVLKNAKN